MAESATPLVLIIRDGWGQNPHPEHGPFNAIEIARSRGLLPVDDMLRREWPGTLIKTSGEDVGLPAGTMGNSEVGHQNIGAGRIVDQESVAITKACRAGLERNAVIASAVTRARDASRAVHFMGICSDAGVHGLLEHLYAGLRACQALGQPANKVYLHLFTDGRDTGPFMGLEFVKQVEARCAEIGIGRIASIIGRYWAMDRDFRWERVHSAYACLTGRDDPRVRRSVSAVEAVRHGYDHPAGENLRGDEYIAPTAIARDDAEAKATRIGPGDTVIFYNYRGDRPREIVSAFVLPDEAWANVKPSPDSGRAGFDRGPRMELEFVTMTAYSEALSPYVKVAFPKPPKMKHIAGEWCAALGLTQFRCAETEKYPHVTFFFNDYRDAPFAGEDRENPQSPKVATYDLKPEMSAGEVCTAVLRRLGGSSLRGESEQSGPESASQSNAKRPATEWQATQDPRGTRDIIIVNFANGDMVGHTGNLEATVRACAAVDACVGRIINAALAVGGTLIITADHGNAEQMWDPATNAPHTAHTTYDVPLHIVGEAFRGVRLRDGGRLADIIPTLLAMGGLPKPAEMTGESLLPPS